MPSIDGPTIKKTASKDCFMAKTMFCDSNQPLALRRNSAHTMPVAIATLSDSEPCRDSG